MKMTIKWFYWWGKTWQKHKAKMRLRAAAPDLLAACYGLWTALVMVPVDWDDPIATENCEDKTRAIDKARAAIYKAEGNKPADTPAREK